LKRLLVLLGPVVLFLSLVTKVGAQPACSSFIGNSCVVYSDCIEQKCRCNATSSKYVMSFGLKYCQRFGAETRLSAAGQAWRDKTLSCLRDEISKAFGQNSGPPCNCAGIQKGAIASHTACYTKAPSFCSLNDADIKVIARIVDAGDVLALGTGGVFETGKTLFECFKQVGIVRGGQIAAVFCSETVNEAGEIGRDYALSALDRAIALAVAQARQEIAVKLRELKEQFRRRLP
jgi:hypothetical protein